MYSISDSLRLQFGLPSFLCVFSLLLSSWTPWSNTIIIHLGKLFSLSSCFTHSVKQPELSHSKYIQWVPISVHKCRMCSCWYHLVYKSALCLLQGCLINGRFYHPFPQGCICVFPEVSRQVEIWCLVSLSHLASMTMFLIVFGPRLLVHVNCYIIIPHSHLEDALGSVSLSLSLSRICLLLATWAALHPVVPETHWSAVSYAIYSSASVVIILSGAAGSSRRLLRACLPDLPAAISAPTVFLGSWCRKWVAKA